MRDRKLLCPKLLNDITGKLTRNFRKTVKYLTVYDFRFSFMVKSKQNSDLTEFYSKVSGNGDTGCLVTKNIKKNVARRHDFQYFPINWDPPKFLGPPGRIWDL